MHLQGLDAPSCQPRLPVAHRQTYCVSPLVGRCQSWFKLRHDGAEVVVGAEHPSVHLRQRVFLLLLALILVWLGLSRSHLSEVSHELLISIPFAFLVDWRLLRGLLECSGLSVETVHSHIPGTGRCLSSPLALSFLGLSADVYGVLFIFALHRQTVGLFLLSNF